MDDLAQLRAVIHAIASTGEPSKLPEMVLRDFVRRMRADIACFYIPTPGEQTLTAEAVYPEELWVSSAELGATFQTRDRDSGGIGKSFRDRKVLLITDPAKAEAEGDYVPFFQDVSSEVIAPVFEGSSLIAVLVASRRSPHDLLSDEDKRVAEIITEFLSFAFRIQREKNTREAGLEFLRNITQMETGIPEVLFARFLESTGAFLPARFISLWLYNALDETLVVRGFYPPNIGRQRITFEQLDSTVLSLDSCLSAATVREQRPQVFLNINENPENGNPVFARRHDLRWFISFPVITEGRRVAAVLNVYPEGERGDISDEDIETTWVLVSQLAPSLMLSGMKRREEMFFTYVRMSRRLLGDVGVGHAWDAIAAQIAIDMQCEAASIFLFDDSSGSLMLRGTTGIEGDPDYSLVSYKVGEGLTGLAFKRQAPVVYYSDFADKYKGAHLSKFREKLRSSIRSRSILLQAIVGEEGDALGVIRCNNKNLSARGNCGRFSDEDVGVLEMIGVVLSDRMWRRE